MMHFRTIVLCCLFVVGGLFAVAQETAPPNDALRFELAVKLAELTEPLSKLDEKYEEALGRIEQEAKSGGDLDTVLAAREEKKRFIEGTGGAAPTNAKVKQARAIYDQERARRIKASEPRIVTLGKQYRDRISELVKELTRQEKIDEALELNREVQRLDAIFLASPNPGGDLLATYANAGDGDASPISSAPTPFTSLPKGSGTLKFAGSQGQKLPDSPATDLSGVVSVASTWNRWVGLKEDGTVIVASFNADFQPPADLKPVTRLEITGSVNFGYHADGTVTAWGSPEGGDADLPPPDLGPVIDIAADHSGGLALLPDGSARIWGSVYTNEAERQELEQRLQGAQFVDATGHLFWALTRNGEVLTWERDEMTPRVVGRHRDVRQFEASTLGYAVLDSRGRVEVGSRWDDRTWLELPSLPPVTRIEANWATFTCQLEDGTWRAFGGQQQELLDRVDALGPVRDLDLSSWGKNAVLVWIE